MKPVLSTTAFLLAGALVGHFIFWPLISAPAPAPAPTFEQRGILADIDYLQRQVEANFQAIKTLQEQHHGDRHLDARASSGEQPE
jgi:hypothetical protein